MKTVREQFEEIWLVPEGVEWSMNVGRYVCNDDACITLERINTCVEWGARLDTFTRCQESHVIVTSLNDELVEALKLCNTQLCSLLDAAEYLTDDQFKAVELAAITLAKARGEK